MPIIDWDWSIADQSWREAVISGSTCKDLGHFHKEVACHLDPSHPEPEWSCRPYPNHLHSALKNLPHLFHLDFCIFFPKPDGSLTFSLYLSQPLINHALSYIFSKSRCAFFRNPDRLPCLCATSRVTEGSPNYRPIQSIPSDGYFAPILYWVPSWVNSFHWFRHRTVMKGLNKTIMLSRLK